MTTQFRPTTAQHATSLLRWDDSDEYEEGFFIGSSGKDESHARNIEGWPYSIYRAAKTPGKTDIVICRGIQNLYDAHQILDRLQCLS